MKNGIVTAVAAAGVLAASSAFACGFHDSVALQKGVMNWAYPESLHVSTAVWRAQSDGLLPRDQPASDEMTAQARSALGILRAQRVMNQLGAALQRKPGQAGRPALAVVLLGPLLWSRFETQGSAVQAQFHVEGPVTGDAVVVTELATIEALLDGRLTLLDAQALGALRIYAPVAVTAGAQRWLSAMTAG